MTLIASDGLEYEDLGKVLLGEPIENGRNSSIRGHREAGRSSEFIRLWAEAWDREDAYIRRAFREEGTSPRFFRAVLFSACYAAARRATAQP